MRLECPLRHLMKCRSLGVSDDNRTDASIDGTIDHLSDWLDQIVPKTDVTAKHDVDVLENRRTQGVVDTPLSRAPASR